MLKQRKIPSKNNISRIKKRDRIVASARDIFLEIGYTAARMDDVAALAQVSKTTIYTHFESKRALFEYVIEARCQGVFGDLKIPNRISDLKSALQKMARDFLQLILSSEAVAIHRVVIAEATLQPEVGEAFFTASRVPIASRVTRLLNELTRHGLLTLPEDQAPLLADVFLGILTGSPHTRALLGLSPSGDAYNAMLVEMTVDLILTRYASPEQTRQTCVQK